MINIICVGNLKEKFLVDCANEYLKRIKRFTKINIIELKESTLEPYSVALLDEANEIKKHLKGYVIKLAINGENLSSEGFAKKIESITLAGNADISFVIGSSFGIHESIKANYDLSFSKMTFPHQIFRIMLLEQIYRAFSINNHLPYHK